METKPAKSRKTCKFQATIQPGEGGGACVLFPYDTQQEFAAKGSIPVQATFDGIPYQGSLMACGGPQPMLGILKAIRKQSGKRSSGVPTDRSSSVGRSAIKSK